MLWVGDFCLIVLLVFVLIVFIFKVVIFKVLNRGVCFEWIFGFCKLLIVGLFFGIELKVFLLFMDVSIILLIELVVDNFNE